MRELLCFRVWACKVSACVALYGLNSLVYTPGLLEPHEAVLGVVDLFALPCLSTSLPNC